MYLFILSKTSGHYMKKMYSFIALNTTATPAVDFAVLKLVKIDNVLKDFLSKTSLHAYNGHYIAKRLE